MQTHAVVAIGDLHSQSTHPRNDARLGALDQIIAGGEALPNLAAWLLAGDLYHGRSTVADRNALAQRIQRMANAAPVVIVRGNHDQPGELDLLGELRAMWPIAVFDTPEVFRVECPGGFVLTVGCLPYPEKGQLIANGAAANETLEAGGQALDDVVRGLAMTLNEASYPLFLAHVNIAGSVASNGQPVIGRELELAPGTLDLFFARVPKLLGHIHRAQEIHEAHYIGSVCRMDFNELEEKRYLVVEYENGHDFARITSRPIAVAPMVLVEGELTRDGFTFETPVGCPVVWDGCEVRVRYRFSASERNVLDHSLVRVPFEGALRLEVEPVAVPDRALRSPEVASAKTLAEKVTAWSKVSGASVTAGVLDKLALLEHVDSAATLQSVTNQITAMAALADAEKSEVAA